MIRRKNSVFMTWFCVWKYLEINSSLTNGFYFIFMTTAPCLRWRKIETGIKVGRHSVDFSSVYLPTWWLHCSRHRWKCFIKMLINVVNFLTFAHISFGPIRGMPRWTHPHPSPVTYFPFICAPMKSWIGPLRSLLLTSFDARLLCHLALSESIRVFPLYPHKQIYRAHK